MEIKISLEKELENNEEITINITRGDTPKLIITDMADIAKEK